MPLANDTASVINRFNQAFLEHDSAGLIDLIAEDCVMASIEPAPNGTRYERYDVCLRFWQALATDANSFFEPEEVVVAQATAPIIRWRYRFGAGDENPVRVVNVMHVRDGKIVEALGYAKSGDRRVAEVLAQSSSES